MIAMEINTVHNKDCMNSTMSITTMLKIGLVTNLKTRLYSNMEIDKIYNKD